MLTTESQVAIELDGGQHLANSEILDVGRQEGMVVVTLDADFHALLALSGVTGPSVIRIRIEGLRGEDLARLLVRVLQICDDDLPKGAMVSLTENGVRIRRLPMLRTPSERPASAIVVDLRTAFFFCVRRQYLRRKSFPILRPILDFGR